MRVEEKPYERFLQYGSEALTDAELMAVMIRTGTDRESALEIGHRILTGNGRSEPSLSVLYDLTLEDLMKIRGVGEVKATRILCLTEIARRLVMDRARSDLVFNRPDTVYNYYRSMFAGERNERLVLVLLDQKLRRLGERIVSMGTVNATLVSAREIFQEALLGGAVHILMMHNHPSGDPTPSGDDIRVTARIREAGEVMGIPLMDHIIIGDGYFSMRQAGLLDGSPTANL